jgi:hypothetical protein
MTPRSCKQKGMRFQNEVKEALLSVRPDLEPDDIRTATSGALGEDILFSPLARRIFKLSIECKMVEKLSIWDAIDQARSNAGNHTPAVAFRKNNEEAYIAVPLSYFLQFFKVTDDQNKD